MRFLYHHRTAGRGAEGLHIMNIVQALEAAGHEVTIVSPPGVNPRITAGSTPLDKGDEGAQGFNRIWRWLSVHAPQMFFEIAELSYNLFAFLRLRRLLRDKAFDVFYERNAFFLFAGTSLAARFKIPIFLEVNEVVGVQRARKQFLVGVARRLENKVFSHSSVIFPVSSFLKSEVEKRGGDGRAVLMPNGIDPRRFEGKRKGDCIRQRLGFDDSIVVGFVGWFDHWDRLDVLIDAVSDVRSRASSVTGAKNLSVLLVGSGPVVSLLNDQIQRLNLEKCVVITGAVPRSEIPDYIDAMDICALPDSNPFGSPMALFEFMAMGKAIIAPQLAPIEDVLTHGETGITIRPGDRVALREALELLAADAELRARIGSQARAYVFANRTWQANAAKIVQCAERTRPCAQAVSR